MDKDSGRTPRTLSALLAALVRCRSLLPVFLCPLSVATTGCAPEKVSGNDPLFGGPAVRPPSAAVAAAPAPAAAGTVPAQPQPPPTGTPAALASGGRGPLDPSRPDLRIGQDPAPAPWGGPGAATPGVALQPPQPLSPKPAADAQLTSNSAAASYEQLRAQLVARGADLITFTTNAPTGETTLTCRVPVPGSPSSHQRYDARARDEVSAMRAVLDQMDRQR
jgi:hypothetical protein